FGCRFGVPFFGGSGSFSLATAWVAMLVPGGVSRNVSGTRSSRVSETNESRARKNRSGLMGSSWLDTPPARRRACGLGSGLLLAFRLRRYDLVTLGPTLQNF